MIHPTAGPMRTVLAVCATLAVFILTACHSSPHRDDPRAKLLKKPSKTNHARLFKVDAFTDGPSVTRACLQCHPDAAKQVMRTPHWTWLGEEQTIPGRDAPVRIGKRNAINNFCISIESNWPKCTTCHAGYGWSDGAYDFTVEANVDCLICHDQSAQYGKGANGLPAAGVDLLASAQSVGRPTRDNCGWCHFNGGGGNAVKHGDLDGSLAKPVERIDVHMGRHDFQCVDCHRTKDHQVAGKMISLNPNDAFEVKCIDCHARAPHRVERLNDHAGALACQACHLPNMAVKEPTKIAWDWSTAGKDIEANPHDYLKIKGSFLYAKNLAPEYYWWNGRANRYIKGDPVNPDGVTPINQPLGSINDPDARIWPFKVHRGKQPYDLAHQYLLVPKTVGPGGYWDEFDWKKSVELASKDTGLEFSGQMGFAETEMYWNLTHMIAPKERALQCVDCHGESGRMNWRALGYDGDPAFSGGRQHRRIAVTEATP